MNILEIHLLTNSITETAFFYEKMMGFKVVLKKNEAITFQIGSTKLRFLLTNIIKKPVYHFAFDIPENKLLEALEWIKNKTQIIEFEPNQYIVDFVNWNAKSFYFYDNNGNILECITRFDLGFTSEKYFSSDSFIKISEIGFVTKDVPAFCDTINLEYGTDFFEKQPKKENFSVLGDNNGLFIVSNENRNWYPTMQKAEPFWSKVIFESNRKRNEFVFDPSN